jgi:hypothetical protein
VRETLREHFGIVPEMRMIDGEIALPDEEPPDHWQELRLAAGDGSGMVTLKYSGNDQVELVVWGNADPKLQQAWHHLTWALAHLTNGTVETDDERYTAEAFATRFLDFE